MFYVDSSFTSVSKLSPEDDDDGLLPGSSGFQQQLTHSLTPNERTHTRSKSVRGLHDLAGKTMNLLFKSPINQSAEILFWQSHIREEDPLVSQSVSRQKKWRELTSGHKSVKFCMLDDMIPGMYSMRNTYSTCISTCRNFIYTRLLCVYRSQVSAHRHVISSQSIHGSEMSESNRRYVITTGCCCCRPSPACYTTGGTHGSRETRCILSSTDQFYQQARTDLM